MCIQTEQVFQQLTHKRQAGWPVRMPLECCWLDQWLNQVGVVLFQMPSYILCRGTENARELFVKKVH